MRAWRGCRYQIFTGECARVDGRLGGMAVHIGARVCALAGAGQVLVSSTVKDLVTGSGIQFEEHGSHTLKGVPGEWRLFALDSQGRPPMIQPETRFSRFLAVTHLRTAQKKQTSGYLDSAFSNSLVCIVSRNSSTAATLPSRIVTRKWYWFW